MKNPLRKLVSPFLFVMSLLMTGQAFALSAAEDIQLIPQMPAQGSFEVTFHPGKTITAGQTVQVQFGVPLPIGVLADSSKLALQLNGVEVPIAVKEIVYWHATDTRAKSIRSVLVTTDIAFADVAPKTGMIIYGVARKANYSKTVPTDPAASWVSISQEVFPTEFSAAADIREPAVYATFSASWLEKSLLRSRAVPVGQNPEMAWFDQGLVEYGKTFVNDVSGLVKPENLQKYETTADPWLFDRAQSLFGVYIRTGDVKWLRHAHRNAQFYKKNIDVNGHFKLKLNDLKYSYGQSMLVNYIFTGDPGIDAAIKNVAKYTATWKETYTYGMNFWTERHQTYALLGALSAWEMTGDSTYLTRATAIVHASLNQTRSPVNGWAANSCILHTLRSHEGDANDNPVCSGWMSAFLSDAVWKYYIHTGDTKALELLSGFGDFIEKYITYVSAEPHLSGKTMPYYLASSVLKISENGDWGNVEHACDVGGFAARTAMAKKMLGQDFKVVRKLAGDYLETCKWNQSYWYRPNSDVNYGTANWRLSPSRKFSWWFGTTLDYDWLLRSIDYVDSKPMPPSNFTAVPLSAPTTSNEVATLPPVEVVPAPQPEPAPTPVTEPVPIAPAPTPEPTPAPSSSTPVNLVEVAFENVTVAAIDTAPAVDFHFDADFIHGNDDGCFDLFIGTHGAADKSSAMYLQQKLQNKCSGKFVYYPNPNLDNYTQPTSTYRVTSNYMFGDYDGNGTWDYIGWDADGGASGMYFNTTPAGQFNPIFAKKVKGCPGSRDRCVIGDINGDNSMDIVSMEDTDKVINGPSPTEKYREIRDLISSAVLYPAVSYTAGEGYGAAYMVFDVDNDTWPDIVDMWGLGYWKNSQGTLSWKSNVFPAGALNDLKYHYGSNTHQIPIDYDSDGDTDLFSMRAMYSSSGSSVPLLMRNNGNGTFTDVSASSGIANVKATAYWTTYSNSAVADLNNDGYPEILFGGETYTNTIVIFWNNGDGTFKRGTATFGAAKADSDAGEPRFSLADYDLDGWVDILKTHAPIGTTHKSIALFRNQGGIANSWMNVVVKGAGKNTDGLGARLVWKVAGTNQVITSYQVFNSPGMNQLQPHAGLGSNKVVDLDVYFPHGGSKYTFNSLPANQNILIDAAGKLTVR